MYTFVSLVRTKSFTLSARQLGVSRSTVTKLIAGLEERLGVQLLVRSTHHVSVTPAGELFAHEALDILDRINQLHHRVEGESNVIKGTIRFGSPPAFASMHLVKAIGDFRRQHPDVIFDLTADNGQVNVIKEGLDFSIRIAPDLPDMALVARLLTRVPQVLTASPAYLAANGEPHAPEDLTSHQCLVHSIKSPNSVWTFDEDKVVNVAGAIRSNLGEALRQAALQGQGISMHPTYMVQADIETGRLVRILPDHQAEQMSVYAVYPQRRFRQRRVIGFLDFIKTWLRRSQDWDAR
jgi:DNA-binding transcriptional LysR family regulator